MDGDQGDTGAGDTLKAGVQKPRTASLLVPLGGATPTGGADGSGMAPTPTPTPAPTTSATAPAPAAPQIAPFTSTPGSHGGLDTGATTIQGRGVTKKNVSHVPLGAGDGAGAGAGAVTHAGAHADDDEDHHDEVKLNMPMIANRDDEDIIVLRNVHKTYLLGIEGVPALRGVSITIKRGEFVVILGKSGSGKTTMLNVIGTIDVPTRGDLYLCGTRVTPKTTDYDLARTRLVDLGFVFQTFNLLPSMTAGENVEMPMVLAGLPSGERKKRARDLLERVGMGHRHNHTPAQLSGGEQQRVTIARALSNRPQVLLLDEPTGDLDTVNSDIVMRLITDLNEYDRTTMVMVTHDVHLRAFAHRVIHMLDGKVQRVETVPASVRAKALRDLRAATAHTTAGKRDDVPDAGNAKEAQEAKRAQAIKETMSYTSVRKPGFYSNLTAAPF